jgi:hypothetical protein
MQGNGNRSVPTALFVDVAVGLSGECSITPASGLKAFLAAH